MRSGRQYLWIALGLLISRASAIAGPAPPSATGNDDPAGSAMMYEAQRIIAAYHAGQPRTNHALRVVYFVPKDRDPLPHYSERLDRVMNDVSEFYRDGLRRFGIETAGLPLERKEGKLVLHIVRGKLPASGYHNGFESGDRATREITQALKGELDLEREYVLVLYALCRKQPGEEYVFDAPYYGVAGSSQRNGLCHAADCELLDPLLLTATNRTMLLTSKIYSHLNLTVAEFNSWFLGGVAHELGHALGLPHDGGGFPEKPFGTSLMGGGNLTYREELWGGGDPDHRRGVWTGAAPTYLGRASALQLATHPLITGSDGGRWDDAGSAFTSLAFSTTNETVLIQGTVGGTVPPYAVIAYAWPAEAKTDHQARPFPSILHEGGFTLALDGLPAGSWHLKLARLHVNGATSHEEFRLDHNDATAPDVAALNEQWIVGQAERAVMHRRPDARQFVSDEALAAARTPAVVEKLQVLRAILDLPAPIALAAVRDNTAFLSDAVWTEASVGWGQLARNYFWFDERVQNGVFLTLGGQFFHKGLFAHSPARFVFPVAKKWQTFTATVGIRDGANIQGSAIFTVCGDGRELFRSRMLRVGDREDVNVDISKVKALELRTDGAEGHNRNSWAIWAEPKVQR